MKKQIFVGALGAVVIAAGGYFGLLSGQASKNDELRDLADVIEVQNAQAQARIPALRAELDNITSQIDGLRALSARVPAQMNLPGLYADLATAAQRAGIAGAVTDVAVTTPTLVAPPAPQQAEPTAAPGEETDPTAEPTTNRPAPAAPAQQPTQTIASFDVTMSVKGTVAQTMAFLRALEFADRLSVVSVSNMNVTVEGEATLQLTAKYFLQEVDVDSLVAQIEALRDAAGSLPSSVPPVSGPGDPAQVADQDASTGAPQDMVEPTD